MFVFRLVFNYYYSTDFLDVDYVSRTKSLNNNNNKKFMNLSISSLSWFATNWLLLIYSIDLNRIFVLHDQNATQKEKCSYKFA